MKRYLDNSSIAEKINISSGNTYRTSYIHKFGAVNSISQNATGTIWDIDDTIYPWNAFDSDGAGILNITLADGADAGKTIEIQGLDSDYNSLKEVITLPNSTTSNFLRVFRAFTTNGSETNIDDITINRNSTPVARISAGKGQTLMSVYTVPNGYTGYLMKGVATAQATKDGTGEMYVRYGGDNSFRIGHEFEVSGDGGAYMYDFSIPIKIPAKSDIDVRITTRTNNGRYSAAFDMILIKDT